MVAAQLNTLACDLARLLVAGSATASANERLLNHAARLRQLGERVPALAALASAVRRVTTAKPETTAVALLDLLLRVRQVQSSLATGGVEGELSPVPESGPWSTEGESGVVGAVGEALLRSGSGRGVRLAEALNGKPVADLRLVDPVLRALGDSYTALADFAAECLLPAFGKPILADLDSAMQMKGTSADARRLTTLARIDPAAGLERCRAALREGSSPVRVAALRSLARLAPAETIPVASAALLGKGGSSLRLAAAEVLGELGEQAVEAVPALIHALRDRDYGVQRRARRPLAKLGRPAAAALIPLLDDPDASVRRQAVWILGDIGPAAAEAVPALIGRLEDPDRSIPWNAASTLGRIGPAARAAVPALKPFRDHPEVRRRVAATVALARITGKPKAALPILIAALADEDGWVRRDAAQALGEIGPPARAAVPALLAVLEDRLGNTSSFAAEALARIGHDVDNLVPLLISLLNETAYWSLRQAAIRALGHLGPRARAALPALRKVAEDRSTYIQEVVHPAIAAIEGDTAKTDQRP